MFTHTQQVSTRSKMLNSGLLLVLVYLVIFLKLDAFHMRWWDESIYAVNTYEMLHNGKFFSPYFNGLPDLFNTKPPLTIWLQMFFVKLFGYNEVSVRLPSALAAGISVFVLFHFSRKYFGVFFAWIAALVLLTSQGFIDFHTARTADTDSVLTLFALLANISFLEAVHETKKSKIILFFLFLSLAFLTKMFAALLFSPAVVILLLRHRKFKALVFNLHFAVGLIGFLFVSLGALWLRESDTPGYLKEIFFKDAGRLFNAVESHGNSWHFYLDNLIFSRYSFWFIPMLLGLYFVILIRKEETLLFDVVLLIVVYIVVISAATTKLHWYDAQFFPLLAIVTAYGLFTVFSKALQLNQLNQKSIPMLLIVFSYPYWIMFRNAQANTIPNGEKEKEASEYFLFLKSNAPSNLNNVKLYYSGWNGSLLFYKYKFAEKGETLVLTNDADFSSGDRVLVSNDSLYSELSKTYVCKVLEQKNKARLIRIE